MRQNRHETGAVCTGEDLQLLGNADESGKVVVLILHGLLQTRKAVELHARMG